jgi:hypothetical protein
MALQARFNAALKENEVKKPTRVQEGHNSDGLAFTAFASMATLSTPLSSLTTRSAFGVLLDAFVYYLSRQRDGIALCFASANSAAIHYNSLPPATGINFSRLSDISSSFSPSGLSQSNYYYERIVISMCPSLPNRSSYLSNSVLS